MPEIESGTYPPHGHVLPLYYIPLKSPGGKLGAVDMALGVYGPPVLGLLGFPLRTHLLAWHSIMRARENG